MAGDSRPGSWKLSDLQRLLKLNLCHFLFLIDAVTMLDFAQAYGSAIKLTLMGRTYAFADNRTRKHIFSEHLLSRVPLVADIHHVVATEARRCASKGKLLEQLVRDLSNAEAQRTFETIIDWGRYAGLFSYDSASGVVTLEDTADRRS